LLLMSTNIIHCSFQISTFLSLLRSYVRCLHVFLGLNKKKLFGAYSSFTTSFEEHVKFCYLKGPPTKTMDILEADGVVAQFCSVTMATPDQARFYLESSEWRLQPALQLYFDSDTSQNCATTLTNLEDYDLSEEESMSSVPVGLQLADDRNNNNINTAVLSPCASRGPVVSRRDVGKREALESSHGPQDSSTMIGHGRRYGPALVEQSPQCR
jgi:hypothetical protein